MNDTKEAEEEPPKQHKIQLIFPAKFASPTCLLFCPFPVMGFGRVGCGNTHTLSKKPNKSMQINMLTKQI